MGKVIPNFLKAQPPHFLHDKDLEPAMKAHPKPGTSRISNPARHGTLNILSIVESRESGYSLHLRNLQLEQSSFREGSLFISSSTHFAMEVTNVRQI